MATKWRRSALSVFCLLAACAQNAQVQRDEPSRGGGTGAKLDRFALEVQVPAASGSGWNLLAHGGTLRSGDRYSLKLTVSEPLYLYAEQRSAGGTQWSWPPAGQRATVQSKSNPLLIPREGFLKLDGTKGTEWIHVVAATVSLSDEALQGELQRLAQEATRDEAEKSNSRNRGEPLRGGLDSRGIGGISFKINHE